MLTRRATLAAAAAVAVLALAACEPLDTTGQSTGKKASSTKKSSGHVVVRYETKNNDGSTSRRSVTVRSGSVARVTSSGGGTVSCRIVLNGRTVVSKSGSGAVTCATRVTR